jgi:hypothetical protein
VDGIARSTPISKDDTSRLVQLVDRARRGLEHIAVASCYGRQAPGPDHAARWVLACQHLIDADRLVAEVIATWNGHYERWGVQGPKPTSAGVRLGCERMTAGLRSIADRLEHGYGLSAEAARDVDQAVEALRDAYRCMWPAMYAAGCRPGQPPVPLDRVRWEDLPAGTPADLVRSAQRVTEPAG